MTPVRSLIADAAVVFVGFAALAMAWYAIYGRTHYQGPPNGHVAL